MYWEIVYLAVLKISLIYEVVWLTYDARNVNWSITGELRYFATNLQSASQQPKVIDTTLTEECKAGRILGPFQHPPLRNFHTSGLGLVPKHDGGWRIIYHLSAPQNFSINDFIDPSLYFLSYCTIDDAYRITNTLGPGALMSKIDLKMPSVLSQSDPKTGIFWEFAGVTNSM